MPRRTRAPSPSSSDDDDGGAPESVSLSQSKQQIQKRDSAVRKAQSSVKEKEREKRREADRRLKERAGENKKKMKKKAQEVEEKQVLDEDSSEDGEDEDEDEDMDDDDASGSDSGSNSGEEDEATKALEARMLRAMRDAENEDDDDEDIELDDDQTNFSDMDSGEDDENNDQASDPNHLPDSLFQAAFQQSISKPSSTKPKTISHPPRKRRTLNQPKDILLGTRKIRVLNNGTAQPNAPLTIPSRKVTKFLNRSLALKGKTTKPKLGWERRPVNIGMLGARNGPAANFVRNQE